MKHVFSQQYRLPNEELNARTIWLTVWDRDLFNTSKFIGEVSLPVALLDLSNPAPKWYKLQDYAQPSLAPSAPTASSSQLAVRRGSTPLRIVTQSAPRRRLMMEQTPMETRGIVDYRCNISRFSSKWLHILQKYRALIIQGSLINQCGLESWIGTEDC